MFGHSSHSRIRFIELLKAHQIECIIDIRSSPRSRFPQFNQNALAQLLSAPGIKYVHAPRLGGRNLLPEAELRRELELFLPPDRRLCFLCSEGDPLKCHRHHLVAPIIRRMGYRVFQILPSGDVWEEP
jgi:uncharacterized protein (DUF488 family)